MRRISFTIYHQGWFHSVRRNPSLNCIHRRRSLAILGQVSQSCTMTGKTGSVHEFSTILIVRSASFPRQTYVSVVFCLVFWKPGRFCCFYRYCCCHSRRHLCFFALVVIVDVVRERHCHSIQFNFIHPNTHT